MQKSSLRYFLDELFGALALLVLFVFICALVIGCAPLPAQVPYSVVNAGGQVTYKPSAPLYGARVYGASPGQVLGIGNDGTILGVSTYSLKVPSKLRIVCGIDSRTANSATDTNKANSWCGNSTAGLLASTSAFAGHVVSVTNVGTSGASYYDALQAYPTNGAQAACRLATASVPTWFFMFGGFNGLDHGGLAHSGTPTNAAQEFADMTALATAAHNDGCTIIPMTNMPAISGRAGYDDDNRAFNQSVRHSIVTGSPFSTAMVDWEGLVYDPGDPVSMNGDNIHQSLQFQSTMARFIDYTFGGVPAPQIGSRYFPDAPGGYGGGDLYARTSIWLGDGTTRFYLSGNVISLFGRSLNIVQNAGQACGTSGGGTAICIGGVNGSSQQIGSVYWGIDGQVQMSRTGGQVTLGLPTGGVFSIYGGFQIYPQRSTTGQRYACIDTFGNVVSSVTACSGT